MDDGATRRGQVRVLIVRVGAMGDVLHGLPAVAALREQMPEAHIGWAVEPRWAALLATEQATEGGAGMPLVDRVHPVPTGAWKQRPFSVETVRGIAALRLELRAERYDVCVDLQGSVRSAVIGWMAGARRFVGAAEPREWLAREFYGERVEVRGRHVIGQACELVEAGVYGRNEPLAIHPMSQNRDMGHPVELPVDAAAERWAGEVSNPRVGAVGPRRNLGHPAGLHVSYPRLVLLSPGAGWGAKRWPAVRYAELARRLGAMGWRVLVNGGADGGEAAEVAREGGAEVVACSVAQLVALTRRAALVVGGDTGPVHLAAALRRPVVALFGPTDPRRTGPYFPGGRVTVLRDSASVVSHKRVAETEAGLARISVEEVFEAAMRMLGESGTAYG